MPSVPPASAACGHLLLEVEAWRRVDFQAAPLSRWESDQQAEAAADGGGQARSSMARAGRCPIESAGVFAWQGAGTFIRREGGILCQAGDDAEVAIVLQGAGKTEESGQSDAAERQDTCSPPRMKQATLRTYPRTPQ